MGAPDYPVDEVDRLQALKRTALLDTPPSQRYDRITRLAAGFFGVQTCLLSLVDRNRQWFKSSVGMELTETGRDISFCGHAILHNGILVVVDATQDDRFSTNPLVIDDPGIRFYAGTPVRAPGGQPIGTLCLIDPLPREFPDEQKQALRDFAELVEHEVARIDQEEIQRKCNSSMARTSSMLATLPDMVFVIDRDCRIKVCNEHPDLKLPSETILGRTIREVAPGDLGEQLTLNVEKSFDSSEVVHHNYTFEATSETFEARFKKIDQKEVLVVIRNTTEQTLIGAELKRLSEVARQTTNGVVITDNEGLVVWINESFTGITGYSLEDMAGKRPGALLQGEDTDQATVDVMRKALINLEAFNVDLINYSKSHAPYWIRISCNPLWGADAELIGYIAIQTDITKEKHDAELISSSQNLLKAVIDANNIGTWRFNMQNGELLINDKWAALLGYMLHELMPINRKTWEDLTHPEDLAYCITQLDKHAEGQISFNDANIRMKHKSGDWVWINTRGRISSYTIDGKAEWLLGTHFDINAQVKAESNFLEKSKQMQAIVENMLDGVISIDGKGEVLTFNKAAEQIFGYSSEEVIGRNVSLLMKSPHREQHDIYIANYIHKGVGNVIGRNRELEALHKNGTVFFIELGLVEAQQFGEVTFIGIVRDITQRKKYDYEINQLAFYDSLTLLPNRRLMLDRLKGVIANCTRLNRYAALLFLDLDNFKNLNDSAGHSKGDLLLRHVAQRLVKTVRQSDTVSRLGGDEFCGGSGRPQCQ